MDSDRMIGHVRHSGHLNFDRDGDLLLDFFGGSARPLGDDGHVVVRDVRIGLDRQLWNETAPHSVSSTASASTTNLLFSAKSTRARIIVWSPSLVSRFACLLIVDGGLKRQRVDHDFLARLQPGQDSAPSCSAADRRSSTSTR